MPYCKKCGAKIDDDSEFCSKCGTKIKKEKLEKVKHKEAKQDAAKSKIWLGAIIGISIIIILAMLIAFQSNRQKQLDLERKQLDLERQLQQIEAEKQFCKDLNYEIRPPPKLGLGYLDVTFSVCSSKNDNAHLTIKLKDGRKIEEDMSLGKDICIIHQAHGVYYDDVSYIKISSYKCPNVEDIVTDINEIKP